MHGIKRKKKKKKKRGAALRNLLTLQIRLITGLHQGDEGWRKRREGANNL